MMLGCLSNCTSAFCPFECDVSRARLQIWCQCLLRCYWDLIDLIFRLTPDIRMEFSKKTIKINYICCISKRLKGNFHKYIIKPCKGIFPVVI